MSLTNQRRQRIQRQEVLREITVRDFSGGWNVVDNDLNLDSKFSTILRNIHRSVDGANSVRPGCELFTDISSIIPTIINMEYFAENLIVVGSNGKLVRVDKNGDFYLLFDQKFANALPGSPNPWGTTDFVSFATFNAELVVCNGLDKPLTISKGMKVTYLQDLATGSNANTPICKYVKTIGRYLVMAGDPDNVSTLYISGTDTTTFVGDPSTDAVNYDLSSRVSRGSDTIKGIGGFRDKLVVGFEEMMLPATLGTFTGDDHTPTFGDVIDNHGVVSHHTMLSIGDDLLFADLNGIHSMRRATFTGATKVDEMSSLINPEIQTWMDRIIEGTNGIVIAENSIFSVYDSQSHTYMLFVPDSSYNVKETLVFSYRKVDALKIDQWQSYGDWNFVAACQSQLKRIFFADRLDGGVIWRMGEEHDLRRTNYKKHALTRDYIGRQETFDDDTPFEDGTGWSPVSDVNDSGVPISWVWELPWFDNDDRFAVKNSKYINFDTVGSDKFTCKMFVDNIYYDSEDFGETFLDGTLFDDGLGWDVDVFDPTLSMEFVGGSSPGYGAGKFGRNFGGGRPTQLEQLYAWTTPYKIGKLRFEGDSINGLKFVSITLGYCSGSIRR